MNERERQGEDIFEQQTESWEAARVLQVDVNGLRKKGPEQWYLQAGFAAHDLGWFLGYYYW